MIWIGQMLVLILAVLGVIWVWRNPRYFLPFVIVSLPLDISKTWFPHLTVLDKLGAFVGVINLARIFSLSLIAYFLYSWGKSYFRKSSWREARFDSGVSGTYGFGDTRDFWKYPLFLALMIYILIGFTSTIWSVNPVKSIAESVRLVILFLLGGATYTLIVREKNAWFIPKAFSLISTFLGLLGIYQMIFEKFLWMGEIYLAAGRVNATFIDANIYARFLIIGILATLIWMIAKPDLRSTSFGALALVIQFIALIGTGSRTGWFTLIVVLLGFVILVPRRQILYVFGGLAVAAGIAIAWHPEFLMRLADLKKGLAVASLERQYLVKAGWDMFMNHPLAGIGLGGFQTMMFTTYPDFIYNEISLSHTALITTAAELGIIGLLGLSAVLLLVYGEILWNERRKKVIPGFTELMNHWLLAVFSVLAITAIFISAQGEGRFFEDPALWILIGLLAGLRKIEVV